MTPEAGGVARRLVRLTLPGERRRVESLLIDIRQLAARHGLTIADIRVASADDEPSPSPTRRPKRGAVAGGPRRSGQLTGRST